MCIGGREHSAGTFCPVGWEFESPMRQWWSAQGNGRYLLTRLVRHKRQSPLIREIRHIQNRIPICDHLFCSVYDVSSKTNAPDLIKTKRFKLENPFFFSINKVSLIFRWFIQIIFLTPNTERKAAVSRPSQDSHMWIKCEQFQDGNLISSEKHSWISRRYRKITARRDYVPCLPLHTGTYLGTTIGISFLYFSIKKIRRIRKDSLVFLSQVLMVLLAWWLVTMSPTTGSGWGTSTAWTCMAQGKSCSCTCKALFRTRRMACARAQHMVRVQHVILILALRLCVRTAYFSLESKYE
jgi:hypothetical protein